MNFHIITIFPKIFDSYFSESIVKRAREKKLIDIKIHNLRDYTVDKHKTVDDTPYGGGAGMVLKVEPVDKCLKSIKLKNKKSRVILFSAKGKRYVQADAKRLSKYDNLIFICGRYEGVDERVAKYLADEEISIGDFVLTGGEIPAMAVIDSIVRLIPGALGNDMSSKNESFSKKSYLEHPQYTKPANYNKWKVPETLLSGNHKLIDDWRNKQSQGSIKFKTQKLKRKTAA